MNSNKLFSAIALTLCLTVIAGAALTSAANSEPVSDEIKAERQAQHQAVHAALETNNYTEFLELTANGPFADQEISEADFKVLAEAHTARQNGDHETAKELMDSLDLELPERGPRGGHGKHKFGPNSEQREAIESALAAGDYEAFQTATADSPFADQVTTENFSTLVEAHELREAGDHEAARELMEAAGFERPERGKHHKHEDHIEQREEELAE